MEPSALQSQAKPGRSEQRGKGRRAARESDRRTTFGGAVDRWRQPQLQAKARIVSVCQRGGLVCRDGSRAEQV